MRMTPTSSRITKAILSLIRESCSFRGEHHVDPDSRAHSKTVGGIPMISDTFLLQKQQTFNRSKNLESQLCHADRYSHWTDRWQEWSIHAEAERSGTLSARKT